ncbi:MAG: DUF2079 domain-containing protein [Candidatus Omnitrophica bacterium]|nr:DUF2079 domain-containing protein [Candidatus Omnitrophota bacterium]
MTLGSLTKKVDPFLLAVTAAAFLVWSALLFLRFWTFEFFDWDLALSAQMLWNLSHGNPVSSIMQVHILGNHANLLVYLLAPLYRVAGSPVFLLLLKVFFCTAAAIPLYAIVRPICGPLLARCFAVAFLLYPPLTHTIAFEFDFESLAPLLLMTLCLAFIENRRLLFTAAAAASILLKESLPLVVLMFALAGFFSRKEKGWWAVVGAAAAAYFVAAVFWIIPSHRGEISAYWTLYDHLGDSPGAVVKNFFFHPGPALHFFFSKSNAWWLLLLSAPVGFLNLLGVDKMLMAAPVFLLNMFSKRFPEQQIFYHYAATPSSFVFLGAAYGAGRLLKLFPGFRPLPLLLGLALIGSSIFSQWMWGPWGVTTPEQFSFPVKLFRDDMDWKRAELIRKIPTDAGVIASFHFLAPLSSREHLYGFHNVYMNRNRMADERKEYVMPEQAEYLLIDVNDPQMISKLLQMPKLANNLYIFYHRHPWRLIEAVEGLVFLKRGEPSPIHLFEISQEKIQLRRESYWQFEGGMRLLKPEQQEVGSAQPGQAIPLSLVWQTVFEGQTMYAVQLTWFNAEGKPVKETIHPIGYRFYPTSLWEPGYLFREHLWLLVPKRIPAGTYTVMVRLLDELNRRVVPHAEREGLFPSPLDIPFGKISIKEAA